MTRTVHDETGGGPETPEPVATDRQIRDEKDFWIAWVLSAASRLDIDPDMGNAICGFAQDIARLVEKRRDQAMEYAKATAEEVNAMERASTDGEIDYNEIDRLTRRLRGVRLQYWHWRTVFPAFLVARERLLGQHGKKWDDYKELRALAGAKRTRVEMNRAAARSAAMVNMDREEYNRLLQSDIDHIRLFRPDMDSGGAPAFGPPILIDEPRNPQDIDPRGRKDTVHPSDRNETGHGIDTVRADRTVTRFPLKPGATLDREAEQARIAAERKALEDGIAAFQKKHGVKIRG